MDPLDVVTATIRAPPAYRQGDEKGAGGARGPPPPGGAEGAAPSPPPHFRDRRGGSSAPQTLLGIGIGIGIGFYFAVDMALATEVLPSSDDLGKDLGVINSADVLPQSIGPALAPLLLAIGRGHNCTALYLFTMAVGLLALLTVTRIKKVR